MRREAGPFLVVKHALLEEVQLRELTKVYGISGSNEEVKFGLLRSAMIKVPDPEGFDIYCWSKDCDLKKVVGNFENDYRAFRSAGLEGLLPGSSI